jgi:histidine triad (HIT) family protein
MKYDEKNVFAKIIAREIDAKKVYEDQYVLAFEDKEPDASVHVLVIPKGPYPDYESFVTKSSIEECAHFFKIINHIAQELDLKTNFRLIINSGKYQHVPHLHVHILGTQIFREDPKKEQNTLE